MYIHNDSGNTHGKGIQYHETGQAFKPNIWDIVNYCA